MSRLLTGRFCPPRCPVQGPTPDRARPLVPNRIYRPKRKIHTGSARRVAAATRGPPGPAARNPDGRQPVRAAEPLALRGRQPFRWAACSQAGQKTCVTRQPDDVSGPNVPAGPGAKPPVWRLADAGSVRLRFPHRRQPPADDRGVWSGPPPPADRACCCPARRMVRVLIPSAPARPHPADLLPCGHHYLASRAALAAVGAVVIDETGAIVEPATYSGEASQAVMSVPHGAPVRDLAENASARIAGPRTPLSPPAVLALIARIALFTTRRIPARQPPAL